MQDTHFWHKFYLFRYKIAILTLVGVGILPTAFAQNNLKENLANYDERGVHYGFLIGIHSSTYKINYSEAYVNSRALSDLHSIEPQNLGGFKLGFISNFKLFQYLDFRALIQVGFYEYQMKYRFTDLTEFVEFRDATMVELPLLFKYKSVRRGNIGMYIVGGFNPSFEASARGEDQNSDDKVVIKKYNLAFDIGVGFDLYFPLFKFSPEIRYSAGLINTLTGEPNPLNIGLGRVSPQNIGIFITFEGGPS